MIEQLLVGGSHVSDSLTFGMVGWLYDYVFQTGGSSTRLVMITVVVTG